MAFAPSGFFSPQVRSLFGRFSLGPPLAKSQKMADLGALAKIVITQLCGHFWSRRLRHNGPPLAKSQKMADLGALAKFVITQLCGHFWSSRFRQNVVRGWHLMARVISRSWHLRQAVFSALKFAHFLADFPLVPP